VRRNYRGGATLDALAGAPTPADGGQPEDWIASTTRAVNPGLSPVPDEGISKVSGPDGQQRLQFRSSQPAKLRSNSCCHCQTESIFPVFLGGLNKGKDIFLGSDTSGRVRHDLQPLKT
jgi:hypothetical protein